MITHLIDAEAFAGDLVTIDGDGYRHLFRARRLAQGAELRLVDGRGGARRGVVESVDRRCGTVRLGEPLPSHEPEHRLRLIVAALRPERASWLVEKATELGVVAIHFIGSERTPRHYGDGFRQRLARVAAAAVMQCHRALVPEITGVDPWQRLEGLLEQVDDEERLCLDPRGPSFRRGDASGGVAVIGPEGGWSDAELRQLDALGCRGVALGRRILRVETAALAVAARWLP